MKLFLRLKKHIFPAAMSLLILFCSINTFDIKPQAKAVMTAEKLAEKCKDIALNYKTLYIMGCFGAPMDNENKERYIENYAYNRRPARAQMIRNASSDTFGFDCVCLIKGILWGWRGDASRTYGGAKYTSNGVPDIDANQMIDVCTSVSSDFGRIEIGEAVWKQGHIGIYIGNGLSVECTPMWKNCVQITACNREIPGYPTRIWQKHGKLPYVSYEEKTKKIYEHALFPADTLSVSKGAFYEFRPDTEKAGKNSFDLTDNKVCKAPFSGTLYVLDNDLKTVSLRSSDKVYFADGTLGYMTAYFSNGRLKSAFKDGSCIKQGTPFYARRSEDINIFVKRGMQNRTYDYGLSGDIRPSDAFFISENTEIKETGGYSWYSKFRINNEHSNHIRSCNSGKIISFASVVPYEGTAARAYAKKNKNFERFDIGTSENGYTIELIGSDCVIGAENGEISDGSFTELSKDSDSACWILERTENGKYIIRSAVNHELVLKCVGTGEASYINAWYWQEDDKTQLWEFSSDPLKPKVYLGDINSDNRVSSVDYIMCKRANIGTYQLKDSQQGRADTDRNGKISPADYAMLKRYVLGTYSMENK